MNEDFYFWWVDKKLSMEERLRMTIKVACVYLCTFIAVLMICALTGCKGTEVVTVERVRTDTVVSHSIKHDSIHVHDSVSVVIKGDTVTRDRWHTEWRDRWQYDTVYIARTDSVPKPYPVVKEVPIQLTSWQQFVLWVGRLTLIALVLAAGYFAVRTHLRKKLKRE